MTIKEFVEFLDKTKAVPSDPEAPSFKDAMMDTVSIWNNDAAIGYMMLAAEKCEIEPEKIRELSEKMRDVFEETSVPEAETYYNEH